MKGRPFGDRGGLPLGSRTSPRTVIRAVANLAPASTTYTNEILPKVAAPAQYPNLCNVPYAFATVKGCIAKRNRDRRCPTIAQSPCDRPNQALFLNGLITRT